MENKAIKTEYVDRKTAAELTEKVTAEIRSQLMTPLIRKIEPLKEVVERIESIEGTNAEYGYIRLPDNRELMNKINEIIETVNQMIEK